MKFTVKDIEDKMVSFPTYAVISVGSINFRRMLAMRVFDNRMEAEKYASQYSKGAAEVVRIKGIEFDESPIWGSLNAPITRPVEPTYPKAEDKPVETELESEKVEPEAVPEETVEKAEKEATDGAEEPKGEDRPSDEVEKGHTQDNKTTGRKANSKYILCKDKATGEVVRVYSSAGVATRAMGKKGDYVGKICRGEKKSTCEFDFEFAAELTDAQRAMIAE